MRIDNEFTVDVPLERAWEVLTGSMARRLVAVVVYVLRR
jgi:carbon monoxide dehydrogenase subunit G